MKKITLAIVASSALLLAVPNAETTAIMQGKGMGQGGNQMMTMQGKGMGQGGSKMMRNKKMAKKRMNSPFLIKHGLPHMTKMIMPYMDDPAFALTAEQKEKLAKVRSETLGAIIEIKPEVISLRKEIVTASTSGTSSAELKSKVEKLASLQASATMVQLSCIEKTKAVLSKDQLMYLLANKNKRMRHGGKYKRQGQGRGQMNKSQ